MKEIPVEQTRSIIEARNRRIGLIKSSDLEFIRHTFTIPPYPEQCQDNPIAVGLDRKQGFEGAVLAGAYLLKLETQPGRAVGDAANRRNLFQGSLVPTWDLF
jgi:hypothetical protein